MGPAGSLEYVEQEDLVFFSDCDVRRVYRTVYIIMVKMVLCKIKKKLAGTHIVVSSLLDLYTSQSLRGTVIPAIITILYMFCE